MSPELRSMVTARNEVALERAFFENECPDLIVVDWREDDAAIVEYCADSLQLPSLTGEWRGDDLIVEFEGREVRVPLQFDEGDRHVTICTLNDLLSPNYEIRF